MSRFAFSRRIAVLLAAGLAAWYAAAAWLVPALIQDAYRGESFGFLNGLIAGQATHPVEVYLDAWSSLALRATAIALGLLVLLYIRKLIRPWTGPLVQRFVRMSPSVSAGSFLLLGLCSGALAGTVETTHLTVRHLIERHPSRGFHWEMVWMAPLSGTLAFGLVAVAVLVLIRFLDRPGRGASPIALAPAVFLFGWLVAYSVLESNRFLLAPVAVVLLSLGLAAVAYRFAAAHPVAVRKLVRRSSIPVAVGLVLCLIVGLVTLPSALERRRLAALPLPAADGPNVLLIVLDTARSSSLSLYGHDRPTTPNLEEWARSGVVFDRAIATAPWTLPSHASLFTGRLYHETSADIGVPLDDEHTTLAEVLSGLGYATAGFAANRSYTTEASGLARGFARWEDYPVTWGLFLTSSWLSSEIADVFLRLHQPPWRVGRKDARAVTDEFLEWLAGVERPFFAFLNYIDPHGPYISPPEFRSRFAPPGEVLEEKREGVTEHELRSTRAAYEAAIAYLDDQLGRLFETLDARDVLDRTLVIVTSDHGEQFGEHGLQTHANSLYMPVVRVPLLILYRDGVPPGLRIATPASIRDIPATVMELVDAGVHEFPGASLSRAWNTDPGSAGPGPESVLAEMSQSDILKPWEPAFRGSLKSIITDRHHYIVHADGRQELYDLRADPREERDLGLAPGHAGLLDTLRARLDSLVRRGSEPTAESARGR